MTDRFVSPCREPGASDREVLNKISEECSEVIQRVCKALKFGLEEAQRGQTMTNRERIEEELGGLYAAVDKAKAVGLLDERHIVKHTRNALEKQERYWQRVHL